MSDRKRIAMVYECNEEDAQKLLRTLYWYDKLQIGTAFNDLKLVVLQELPGNSE